MNDAAIPSRLVRRIDGRQVSSLDLPYGLTSPGGMAKRRAAMFDLDRAKIRGGGQRAVRQHAHANSRGHATRKLGGGEALRTTRPLFDYAR